MAIVNVNGPDATVRRWPKSSGSSEFVDINISGTVNDKTLKPEMTVRLPGGKTITGDINYWNSIKSAGGVPGLNEEQSYYMTQFLTQPTQTVKDSSGFPVKLKGFPALKEVYSSVDETLKEREREDTLPGTKTSTEDLTLPDGTKVKTTTVNEVSEPRNPASENNPTSQPSTINQTPGDNADKKQIVGAGDDDQSPNKQNTVDGTNTGSTVAKDEFGLPVGTIIDPTGWGPSAGSSNSQTDSSGKPSGSRRTYNPLAQLSSYSYIITLYMISPDAYKAFIDSGRKKIDALSKATPVGEGSPNVEGGALIVARTGGNNTTDRIGNMDYFIDNLRMSSYINTKTTGAAIAAVSEISFTISEPYGFRFITDLKNAVKRLQAQSTSASYKSMTSLFKQFFILGIKYYGYDADGNLIKGTDKLYGNMVDPLGGDGLFENFYDIQIQDFRFRLTGDTVTYNVTAAVPVTQNVLGVKRGRIPTGATVQGKTVEDALIGEYGLFTNLNKKEEDKLKNGNVTYPNKFSVVFMGEAEQLIKKSPLVTSNDLEKARFGDPLLNTTKEVNETQAQSPPDTTSRILSFGHDTSIISAIETIIKKSAYMVDALNTLYTNAKEPNPSQKNYEQINQEPQTLRWFTVTSDIKKVDWDPKTNDWAYDLVYIIQVYDIPSMETPYYSTTSKYRGPHKRYDYWFTGQNSEVLDLDFTLDNTYFLSIMGFPNKNTQPSASTPGNRETNTDQRQTTGPAAGNGNSTANSTGLKNDPQAPNNQGPSEKNASGGGEFSVAPGIVNNADKSSSLGVGLEAENTVATYLYDPQAFSTARLQIIGDPDFLVRDSTTTINSLYNQYYNTDGFTPNANGGQVFVEIGFKEGVDYRDTDGLLNINDNILFLTYPDYVKKISENRIVYMVAQVDSLFNRGRFTQTLSLVQPYFPGSSTAPPTAPAQSTPAQNPNNSQTVSDTSKGTTTANDDALQEVQVTGRRVSPAPAKTEGRQSDNLANKTDAELFTLGYMPDEFDKVRNGGG